MSMVKYLLRDCIARPPDETGKQYPLTEHLLAVAHAMGDPQGDCHARLRFLAGLLHDAGKARAVWQDYIRFPKKKRSRGVVPHAFAGAMLFALVLEELLTTWSVPRSENNALIHLGVYLTYFIFNHHGPVPEAIKDVPPWQASFSPEELFSCDLEGLLGLIGEHFPELKQIRTGVTPAQFKERFNRISAYWPRWHNKALGYVSKVQREGNLYAQSAWICLSNSLENRRLIAGDRLHAAHLGVDTDGERAIAPERAAEIFNKIAMFCTKRREMLAADGAQNALLEKREACRHAALNTFRNAQSGYLFTLELPTGYGKTLTSLSIALNAVAAGLSRRIIYVAPYISILSQAAAEIATATGLEVVLHHHLSALERSLLEMEQDECESIEIESWLSPIVATTYNQFFRALFPVRAQHTLRLTGLEEAFVIIDEPQTIAATSWNLFLSLIEAATRILGCRVLFASATLPETGGGILKSSCISLGREQPLFNRYHIQALGQLDEETLAAEAIKAFHEFGTVAVILNTIRDAAEVHRRIKSYLGEEARGQIYFLSGLLTSLHKRARIAQIRRALEEKSPVMVICTQVLEAGVDLSFCAVFRALPLVPSIVQAAGRCNRHGESEFGCLYLFDFRRGGNEDTRRYIYRDHIQREVTDILLQKYPSAKEMESTTLVDEFYKECFKLNANQAVLKKLENGANGHWGELSGIEPFGPKDAYTYGVFVPQLYGEPPDFVVRALQYFGTYEPGELWNMYISRGFLSSLSFTDRKRFMSLMYQFIVQVPENIARDIGEPVADRALLRLRYQSQYREDMGLSFLTEDEPYAEQFI